MEAEIGNTDSTLQCPTCRNRLNVNRSVERLDEKCPVCSSDIKVSVFPRFFFEEADQTKASLASEDEAVCAFYPELKAEKVCDECGCLMSAKASVKWGDSDYCLPCLYRLREEEKKVSFLAEAKLYDNRALAMVTWMAPLSMFTAPIALFLLLRYRKNNQSFIPRSGARWWLAFILATGWLIFWSVMIVIWISLIVDELS